MFQVIIQLLTSPGVHKSHVLLLQFPKKHQSCPLPVVTSAHLKVTLQTKATMTVCLNQTSAKDQCSLHLIRRDYKVRRGWGKGELLVLPSCQHVPLAVNHPLVMKHDLRFLCTLGVCDFLIFRSKLLGFKGTVSSRHERSEF